MVFGIFCFEDIKLKIEIEIKINDQIKYYYQDIKYHIIKVFHLNTYITKQQFINPKTMQRQVGKLIFRIPL